MSDTNESRATTIVVGVDGSEPSRAALRRAARIAELIDGTVEAVTTWEFPVMVDTFAIAPEWSPEDSAKGLLEVALAEAFPKGVPAIVGAVTVMGQAASVLIERSRGAHLLVVGSRGHGGFAGLLLGSVSMACAAHAKCPVLILHGTEPEDMRPEV